MGYLGLNKDSSIQGLGVGRGLRIGFPKPSTLNQVLGVESLGFREGSGIQGIQGLVKKRGLAWGFTSVCKVHCRFWYPW